MRGVPLPSPSQALRKLPDLERLLARVHAFSVGHAQNQATHYQDVSRARLGELIKTLEGFETLDGALRMPPTGPPHLPPLVPRATTLSSYLGATCHR